MDALAVGGSGLLAAAIGPVLNVLIDRVPSKAPLRGARDGEVCAPVAWLGVPAQPWLFRRGRVGDRPLPRRWLAVEVATIATFMVMAARFPSLELVALLLLTASLITVSVIDLQLLRIPDRITFPTLAIAVPLVFALSLHRDSIAAFEAALVGSIGYFLLLFVPHFIYPKGMGFGDVKLALVMGLYLGWVGWSPGYPTIGPIRLVLYALIVGCMLGVLFGVVAQLVTRRRGAFPFGPALALGCLVIIYFARDLRI